MSDIPEPITADVSSVILQPEQPLVKYKNIEEAQGEINKLKDENIKRRLREKESQELIKKMEDENSKRFLQLEKELRDAKLAKQGIEKPEELELFEFYSAKGLKEEEAVLKIKSIFKQETVPQNSSVQTASRQTGFAGMGNLKPQSTEEFPSDFGKLSAGQKVRLIEQNPGKYYELLNSYKQAR